VDEVKVVIADSKQGRCYQVELDATKSRPLFGLKIGDPVEGALLGLSDYKLVITGGTDKDGFPMRKDMHGTERRAVLLRGPPGFKPVERGERRKKTIRGNTLAEDIAQLNVKVVQAGAKPIAETLGIPEKPPKEKKAKEGEAAAEPPKAEEKTEKEAPKPEAKKEEKKLEAKKEEKKAEEKAKPAKKPSEARSAEATTAPREKKE
jgi:small subunit ribosomal protein S6e